MDIPDEALDEFKCSGCEGFLSVGPVFLQHDGDAVCGRCHASERPATRNKQYEAAARFLRFPCKYRDLGCRHTASYTAEQGPNKHEEMCDHRQYVCPILGSSRCDWLGPRGGILKHCQEQHPDRVLDNPCSLEHNITKPSVHTYLLRALHVLFLLHTKVCVATGKLYHAVRFLGASDEAADYNYTLDIRCGDEQLTKKGQVVGQGCLAMQEPTSLALDTNSLLSVLGGFDGATFTLAVKGLLRCVGCRARLAALLYRDKKGWYCECCTPAKRVCENQKHGCQHSDIDQKCTKHEKYFCEQGTWCFICQASVSRGELFAHYGSAHRTGSTFRATWTDLNGRFCLMSGAAGTAVCGYVLQDTEFKLWMRFSASCARLSEFRCMVRLTDPATEHTRTFTPEVCYNDIYDWRIAVKKAELPSWSGQFDVCVEVSKIEPQLYI